MGPGKDSDRDGIELDGAVTEGPGIHTTVAILHGALGHSLPVAIKDLL